jgi:hypothetical protein
MSQVCPRVPAETNFYRIDRFCFGIITIAGADFQEDLALFEDRVIPHWHRSESHLLQLADVAGLLAYEPEALILGRGTQQGLKLSPELLAHTRAAGIELLAFDTRTACQTYNHLLGKRRIAGAFHLTC